MTLKEPSEMEELVYYTRRKLGDCGKIICWVEKELCEKCGKGLMEKPKDPKTGRPKIRSTEYVCNHCDNNEEKVEYESKLEAKAKYTCPHCNKEGDAVGPYKRKTIAGVSTLRLQCQHCGGNLDVTKKMKEPKKKK
jgi:DNA-directed RNA polymerase subunit RPC12/RpoP